MRYQLFLGALLALAGHALAATVPGEAQSCVACHGDKGQGTAQAPKLAGLSAVYMSAQIDYFLDGHRKNPLMTAMAQSVAEPAARQTALDYFASMPVSQPKLQLRGEKIDLSGPAKLYYQGDNQRGFPACYSCHGPSAVGGGHMPRLAGQQAAYLLAQLQAWQKGERSGDPDNTMATVAKMLEASEIASMASYLSAIQ